MKQYLVFEIECGQITCASEPGKFCKFFNADVRDDGNCLFFGKVFAIDGWVMRHKLCVEKAIGK